MSEIIGLNGIRPSGADTVYLQVEKINLSTLLRMEKAIRAVVAANGSAEWNEIAAALEPQGFLSILHPRNNPVFIHSRPWDEHLVGGGRSFFVAFPENAPYEVLGQMMLATPYPLLYCPISADYLGKGKVVVLNNDLDPVYHDDFPWATQERLERVHIGAVIVVKEQFFSEEEYNSAIQTLLSSGYEVTVDELICLD